MKKKFEVWLRADHHGAGVEPLEALFGDDVLRFLGGVEAVAALLAEAAADDFAAVFGAAAQHLGDGVAALGTRAGDPLAPPVLAGVEL